MRLRPAAVMVAFLVFRGAQAAPPRVTFQETASRTRYFEQVALSPDGKRLAWVEDLPETGTSLPGRTAIFTADLDGGNRTQITAGSGARGEGGVAWAPDSSKIAFLSDAGKPGRQQVYEAPYQGGAARRLTQVEGALSQMRWSPDGKTLSVLVIEGAPGPAGPLAASAHETGEIKDAFFEQRLALVDAGNLAFRWVSPADTYIYEYAWAPDGRKLAVVAAKGNGDNNWWIAQLHLLDPATGSLTAVYKPTFQIAQPTWSPDGTTLAFIEGIMSDQGVTGGSILTVPARGGAATNLTAGRKASPSWLEWTGKGTIVFTETVGGDSAVGVLDPATGRAQTLQRGPEYLSCSSWSPGLSLSRDGRVSAAVRSSFSAPPEIWAGSAGAWKQVTHANDGLAPAWGQAKSLAWKNGAFDCQGWLIYPRDFDPARTYPMVVNVHGGPSASSGAEWPYADSEIALCEAGFFIFRPNPRGSFGQGDAFARANVRDFGYGDLSDVLAGVDEALRQAPIDGKRLGIMGWSYGGYLTMWAVTQTQRFKAALAGAGISNWQSYYGENKIDQWMLPFFGKSVYDDPQIYARSSPMTFIKNVKTPTLVVVGDSDAECPAPQSYEFWHALKTLGVETSLVVYEKEGHGFSDPAHQKDLSERTAAWFTSRLGSAQ